MDRPLLAGLIGLSLAACSAPATPAPTPALPAVLVTSPALEPLVLGWLQSYEQSHGPLTFDLQIRSSEEALGAAEFRIQPGPPAGQAFTTPVGWEAIAVIVSPDVSKRDFSLDELADIFTGRRTDWADFEAGSGPIQPVIPPAGDELRAAFQARVLHTSPFASTARLAATPKSMADTVGQSAGTIGILPLSQDQGSSRVVRVAGQLPDSTRLGSRDYALTVQIVGVGSHPPPADIYAFLAWLQSTGNSSP